MTGAWIDAVAVMAATDTEGFEAVLERNVSGLDVTYWKLECPAAAPVAVVGLELRDAGVLGRLEEALDAERASFTGQHPAIIPV